MSIGGLAMKIIKGTTEYSVSERSEYWIVSYSAGKLIVEYKIFKSECATFDELKHRIITSDEFGG